MSLFRHQLKIDNSWRLEAAKCRQEEEKSDLLSIFVQSGILVHDPDGEIEIPRGKYMGNYSVAKGKK